MQPFVFGNSFDSVQNAAQGYDRLNFEIANSNREAQARAAAAQQEQYNFQARQQAEQEATQAKLLQDQQYQQQALTDAQLGRNNEMYRFNTGQADRSKEDAERIREFNVGLTGKGSNGFNNALTDIGNGVVLNTDPNYLNKTYGVSDKGEVERLTATVQARQQAIDEQDQKAINQAKQAQANADLLNAQLDDIEVKAKAAKDPNIEATLAAAKFKLSNGKHPGVDIDPDTGKFKPYLNPPPVRPWNQKTDPNNDSTDVSGEPMDSPDATLPPLPPANIPVGNQPTLSSVIAARPRVTGTGSFTTEAPPPAPLPVIRSDGQANPRWSPLPGLPASNNVDTSGSPASPLPLPKLANGNVDQDQLIPWKSYTDGSGTVQVWNGTTWQPPFNFGTTSTAPVIAPSVGGASASWTPPVAAAAVPNDMVRVKNPNGQIGRIPRAKLNAAFRQGYILAQ